VGSHNGGMISHGEGVSTFTLLSAEIADMNDVPASRYQGKFTDLTLYGSNHAYAIFQPNSGNSQDTLVQFELKNFVSWEIIDHDVIYYRNGFHIRKDKTDSSICFLSSIETVTVMNNPQHSTYRQRVPFKVTYPVHDFIMIGYYELLICGLNGEVDLKSYNDRKDDKSLIYFKLNLEAKEYVSFVRKSCDDKYIFFLTTMFANPNRIFIYKYSNKTLEYCCEWFFMEAKKGQDSTRLLATM
jgi:hypothetical protein